MSASSEKLFVIVNPVAGNGQAGKRWPLLQQQLQQAGLSFDFALTGRSGEGMDLARTALQKGFRQLVVVGGDGSLNEVLNGCWLQSKSDLSGIVLGMVPMGTGNDWPKAHGISPQNAWEPIIGRQKVFHDVGVLRFGEKGRMGERLFLNVASFGFAGTVVKQKSQMGEQHFLGAAAYIFALITSLFGQKPFGAEISIDGSKRQGTYFNISVGHGQFFGGGMKILPTSDFRDGLFSISLVSKISRLKVAANILRLFDGTYIRNKEVALQTGKSLTLQFDRPVYCEAEGELIAQNDYFELSILENAVQVFSNTKKH